MIVALLVLIFLAILFPGVFRAAFSLFALVILVAVLTPGSKPEEQSAAAAVASHGEAVPEH